MPAEPDDYLFRSAQDHRIRAAEEFFDEGTKRVISALPYDRGGVALEVGAGGGSIARWLSETSSPGGRVVATDIDTGPLLAQPAPDHLTVLKHNIVDDELEAQAYDLIHARLLLEHLPARLQVLGKLINALRPGGWLLIEDVDYAGAVPVSDFGSAIHERVQSVRLTEFARNGIDHYLGRRLPELMRREGLHNVGHDGRVSLMEGGSAGARWLKLSLSFLRGRLVGPELLSDEEIDEMLELLDNPEWSAIGPIMIAAWGQRRAEAQGVGQSHGCRA